MTNEQTNNNPQKATAMTSSPANSNAQKLSIAIKKTWAKLTDQEVAFYEGKRDQFFEAVKTKYSIAKDEAEKTVKKLEAECADSSCNANSGKDSKVASGPTAKPANDSSSPLPKAANS